MGNGRKKASAVAGSLRRGRKAQPRAATPEAAAHSQRSAGHRLPPELLRIIAIYLRSPEDKPKALLAFMSVCKESYLAGIPFLTEHLPLASIGCSERTWRSFLEDPFGTDKLDFVRAVTFGSMYGFFDNETFGRQIDLLRRCVPRVRQVRIQGDFFYNEERSSEIWTVLCEAPLLESIGFAARNFIRPRGTGFWLPPTVRSFSLDSVHVVGGARRDVLSDLEQHAARLDGFCLERYIDSEIGIGPELASKMVALSILSDDLGWLFRAPGIRPREMRIVFGALDRFPLPDGILPSVRRASVVLSSAAQMEWMLCHFPKIEEVALSGLSAMRPWPAADSPDLASLARRIRGAPDLRIVVSLHRHLNYAESEVNWWRAFPNVDLKWRG
ncbi:hypothetical protein DFJ74DRAFT_715519 [Hyaloraphidium curvatum]|nr:hypothetical protein DFJ74DRAFT_715519 [Hyaloraphidium curvatum]